MTTVSEIERHIDWAFVAGFSVIGMMILTHFLLSLKKRIFHARGAYVFERVTPKSFWVMVGIEAVLLMIVFGGLALYLTEGGTPEFVRAPQEVRPS